MRTFYNKVARFTQVGKKIEVGILSVPWKNVGKQSYLGFTPKEELDEIDLDFVKFAQQKKKSKKLSNKFVKLEVLGKHTYGGYYAFFRPDLKEVYGLLEGKIPEDYKRIYLDTQPHPSDNIEHCYDPIKGKTTAYIAL